MYAGPLRPFALLLALAGCGGGASSTPEVVHVAVAANFLAPLEAIAERFEARTGLRVVVTSGSTGLLHAQIVHGAPTDVFLAADELRPRRLELDGLVAPGGRFTYAVGRLALLAPAHAPVIGPEVLGAKDLRHVAIANPGTAPYGEAAREALLALGWWARVEPRLVQGESIAQTHQFVASGAAEAGFVAWSQVLGADARTYWLVPDELHAPIRQQAVLLAHAAEEPAARAFFDFLRGEEVAALVAAAGYAVQR